MRRILVLFVVALVMAAMMVASALPALASSCLANNVTSQLGPGQQGNTFGQRVSGQAQNAPVPLGQIVTISAQQQCD
jgi:hypothetical protein